MSPYLSLQAPRPLCPEEPALRFELLTFMLQQSKTFLPRFLREEHGAARDEPTPSTQRSPGGPARTPRPSLHATAPSPRTLPPSPRRCECPRTRPGVLVPARAGGELSRGELAASKSSHTRCLGPGGLCAAVSSPAGRALPSHPAPSPPPEAADHTGHARACQSSGLCVAPVLRCVSDVLPCTYDRCVWGMSRRK